MSASPHYWPTGYWIEAASVAPPLAPPAVPTLAIVANPSGSGVIATITGATDGTTNTIYAQKLDENYPAVEWKAVGTITGNGMLVIPLDPATYFFHCSSSL